MIFLLDLLSFEEETLDNQYESLQLLFIPNLFSYWMGMGEAEFYS